MSTDRIKVTKKHYIPLRICFLDICKNLLQHGFCPSVRIGALSFRAFLCDRNNCRIAIYSCRGRENNIFDSMLSHYIYQCKGTCDIVFIIFPRFCNRLTHCFKSCKMNTGINVFFFENFIQSLSVENIYFIKFNWFTCNLFYTFKTLLTGVAQVVQYYYIISCILKFYYGVASNKTSSTCY